VDKTEMNMDPNGLSDIGAGLAAGLAGVGAGLAVGLAAIGTGIAQSRIGAAGLGVIAEKPKMLGMVILLIALPETMVILGFAVAAMVLLLS
jgi:V/A-type H+-transporting ATPase subunit K